MRTSLTARLLAGVVLSQLVLAGGLVWLGIAFTRRQLRVAFDTGLQGRLMSVAAVVRYPETGRGLIFDATLLPPAANGRHPSFYQVRSAGRVVASTFPAGVALPEAVAGGAQHWDFAIGEARYRGLVLRRLPILDSEENLTGPPALLTVYYAAPTREADREITVAGLAIGGSSLGLLLLTSVLAGLAIGRGLQPLRQLAAQAAEISPHNWRFQASLPAASEAELQPLILALDRMLRRLHDSYQQQRAFMADAAHHLKTPVTILKSTLQTMLRQPREAREYEAAAQASLADVERLEQLLQRMLRLARLEQGATQDAARSLAVIGLGATCQGALERVRPLAQARGVELRGRGTEARLRLRADPDDLEQVWVNLLENAIQHSPAGGVVEIACAAPETGMAEVVVRDQGPGIAAADAPHIFERFRRGTASAPAAEPGGFGLGLAIARTIVEGYGGRIRLDPSEARGAALRVQLPLTEIGNAT